MGYRVKIAKRWPDGKIYYTFNKNVKQDERDLVVDSMRLWETFVNSAAERTLIQFMPGTGNEPNLVTVRFNDSEGCSAGSVGLYNTKKPYFDIGRQGLKSLPHELAHTIGLVHEHERIHPDNTDGNNNTMPPIYLLFIGPKRVPSLIDPNQMQDSFKWQLYDKSSKAHVRVGAYDVASITHYPALANERAWRGTNLGENFDEWEHLTYPSEEAVKARTWQPSDGDLAAAIELYTTNQD